MFSMTEYSCSWSSTLCIVTYMYIYIYTYTYIYRRMCKSMYCMDDKDAPGRRRGRRGKTRVRRPSLGAQQPNGPMAQWPWKDPGWPKVSHMEVSINGGTPNHPFLWDFPLKIIHMFPLILHISRELSQTSNSELSSLTISDLHLFTSTTSLSNPFSQKPPLRYFFAELVGELFLF